MRAATVSGRDLDPRLRRLALNLVIVACVIGCGAVVAGGGVLAAAVLGMIASAALVVVAYMTKPLQTVLWVWAFLLVQRPLAVALGRDTAAGSALDRAENPLIALLVVLSIASLVRRRHPARILLFVPPIGFLAAGVVSGVLRDVPVSVSVSGAFLGVKTYSALIIGVALPWSEAAFDRALRFMVRFAIGVAVLAIVDFAAQGAFRVPPFSSISDTRLGLESARSIFHNPALLSSFMLLTLAPLLARYAIKGRRGDLPVLGLLALAGAFSLRLKALLGIASSVAVVAMLAPKSLARTLGPYSLAAIGVVLAVSGLVADVAGRQIAAYAGAEQDRPREVLYSTGVRIAADRFPLGAGFGRFGSAPSKQPYSPVYDEYDLSGRRGFTREEPSFVQDTSWATIVGETGVLGLAFFGGGLILIGLRLWRALRAGAHEPWRRAVLLAGLTTLVAFLTESAGRPALFDAFAALSVGLFTGAALSTDDGQRA